MITPKDLLSAEELEEYETTPYPFNLPVLFTPLEKKLKEDPTYELWVPFKYQRYEKMMRTSASTWVDIPNLYVSSQGTFATIINGKMGSPIKQSTNTDGYSVFWPRIGKGVEVCLVHRSLACSFIPIPHELGPVMPKDLQVNHKDGIKTNYDLSNLEWATVQMNSAHALATGLRVHASAEKHFRTKPLRVEVLRGPFKGHTFVVIGDKDKKVCGLSPATITRVMSGKLNEHANCTFSYASTEEVASLPRCIPQEIVESLKDLVPRPPRVIVMINLETLEEKEIVLSRKVMRELGLSFSSVARILQGERKSTKGYTFREK